MSPAEMELEIEELEELISEIGDAADDPDLSDTDARAEIRDLLADGDRDDE